IQPRNTPNTRKERKLTTNGTNCTNEDSCIRVIRPIRSCPVFFQAAADYLVAAWGPGRVIRGWPGDLTRLPSGNDNRVRNHWPSHSLTSHQGEPFHGRTD